MTRDIEQEVKDLQALCRMLGMPVPTHEQALLCVSPSEIQLRMPRRSGKTTLRKKAEEDHDEGD